MRKTPFEVYALRIGGRAARNLIGEKRMQMCKRACELSRFTLKMCFFKCHPLQSAEHLGLNIFIIYKL